MQLATRKLPRPPRPIRVPRWGIGRTDPIVLIAEQLRSVRQVAATPASDDDPVDNLLAQVGLAQRGVAA